MRSISYLMVMPCILISRKVVAGVQKDLNTEQHIAHEKYAW